MLCTELFMNNKNKFSNCYYIFETKDDLLQRTSRLLRCKLNIKFQLLYILSFLVKILLRIKSLLCTFMKVVTLQISKNFVAIHGLSLIKRKKVRFAFPKVLQRISIEDVTLQCHWLRGNIYSNTVPQSENLKGKKYYNRQFHDTNAPCYATTATNVDYQPHKRLMKIKLKNWIGFHSTFLYIYSVLPKIIIQYLSSCDMKYFFRRFFVVVY